PVTPTTPPVTPAPTTEPPKTAPGLGLVVSKFKAFGSPIKAGTRLPGLTTAKLGSQLRFSISKPATVLIRFEKRSSGRKARFTPVRGSFTVKPTKAGDYKVRFQGRVTSKITLKPGRYRAIASAKGADGETAPAVRTGFSIKTS
ncbi:MAG: hypothetical protein JHC95_23090, partial [Solirubrobacteraceae bacterium]|nr:hypothetical protein [Solirubrobacteraceae bacterium]